MAQQQHLDLLEQGVRLWNCLMHTYIDVVPDLTNADLSEAKLNRVDFSRTDLRGANLQGAHLRGAQLSYAWLEEWICARQICVELS